MEIVTLQRRLVEVGRIRLGAKKTSAAGKSYPAKLDKFRLTSRDKQRLEAAAALYGGNVEAWENGFELFTDADVLPVAVVPGQALSQSFELWGQKPLPGNKKTGVICLRRCDGETESLSGEPCFCASEEDPPCKPTSRLSVVLTEVPGIGVWRVETHGFNAAVELAGSVQLLEALVATGRPVRARLRLDAREQVTESETRRFVVPVLDIDHTLGQVLDSIGPARVEQTALPDAPRFTPVPAALEAPKASIAEQVKEPPKAKARKSSSPAVPATRKPPRTAAQATEPATTIEKGKAVKSVDPIGEEAYLAMKQRVEALDAEHYDLVKKAMGEKRLVIRAESSKADAVEAEKVLVAIEKQQQEVFDGRRRAVFAELGRLPDAPLSDEARHVFVLQATGETESTSRLSESQKDLIVGAVEAALEEAGAA